MSLTVIQSNGSVRVDRSVSQPLRSVTVRRRNDRTAFAKHAEHITRIILKVNSTFRMRMYGTQRVIMVVVMRNLVEMWLVERITVIDSSWLLILIVIEQ